MLKLTYCDNTICKILDSVDGVEEECNTSLYSKLSKLIDIKEEIQPIVESKNVTEPDINIEQFTTEYTGLDAFNKLKEAANNSKFILKGVNDIVAEKVSYEKAGLSMSGFKEIIKIKINNKIQNFSLDYMKNAKVSIVC